VVRWEPEAIICGVFDDPADRAAVRKEIFAHPDWLELDRGTLARDEAVVRGAQRTGLPEAEVERLLQHVPPSLVPIPATVELLYRLKARGHALYCLSNMHFASIEHLERMHSFLEVFTGKVISCRLQLCKPEPGIYAHLLKAHGLDAPSTLFIDDVEANLKGAAQLGIRTLKFEDPEQCERELHALGYL
jgi:putative hydrolase of the HAD superfamily